MGQDIRTIKTLKNELNLSRSTMNKLCNWFTVNSAGFRVIRRHALKGQLLPSLYLFTISIPQENVVQGQHDRCQRNEEYVRHYRQDSD